MKKVLISTPFLHHNYLPWVNAFKKNNIDVSFISLSDTLKYEDDIKVYYLAKGIGRIGKIFYCPSLIKLYKIVKSEQPDLFIARDLSLTNIFLSKISKFIFGSKVIYYDQNDVVVSHKFRTISKIFISNTLITTAKKYNINSPEQKNNNYFIPFCIEGRTTIDEIKGKLNNLKKIRIVTVGKLYVERKNLLLLLKSIEYLLLKDKVELIIVGRLMGYHNDTSKILFSRINFLKSKGAKIELYIDLKQKEVFKQYKRSHLFVLLSENEPASISQFEAMSYGLPVILSCDNGTWYAVKNGYNGYLIKPDKNEIYKIISKLISDKNRLNKMSLNSLKLINNKYSIESFMHRIKNIYKNI
ncbi:MAG: glycosyltransferase family 4 protein [Cyclobacteriaceae bacterium]|nr:glycosyltransferase family 4 protein [Cyclobacteriaceae bacterium]